MVKLDDSSHTAGVLAPGEELAAGQGSVLDPTDTFVRRHLGPSEADIRQMLETIGVGSLEELVAQTVPESIRLRAPLTLAGLPADRELGEHELLAAPARMAEKNQVFRSFLGMGYYDTLTPPVIQRNILENPGWYTAVHALPGRDRPGPPGSAAQLPDDGRRPHRPADRQRLAARRGAPPPPRPCTCATPSRRRRAQRLLRRRGLPSADDRRGRNPRRAARHRGAGRRSGGDRLRGGRPLRRAGPVPGDRRPGRRLRGPSSSAPTPRARWSWWPPTCWPSRC